MFPRSDSFESEIFKRLQPDRCSSVSGHGRTHGGGPQAACAAVFANRSVDDERTDWLVGLLGHSGAADKGILQEAMRRNFRFSEEGYLLWSFTDRNGLALLLMNLPEADWHPYLEAFLRDPPSRGGAIHTLGDSPERRKMPL